MPAIQFPGGLNGGDTMVVGNGGTINVETGGAIMLGATELTEATVALTDLTASAAELNKLDGAGAVVASGTQVAHLADLATDANGTAIAANVNAIRDALIAFGLMAAE